MNSSPGFEGLEAATGLDIAGLYVEREVEFARRHTAEAAAAR